MNQTSETGKIVAQFLELLAKRDLAVVDLFIDKPDWYIQGNESLAPWLGKRNTKEQVKEFFLLLWSGTEPLVANVEHIVVQGELAVISGEFTTKMLKTGRIVNSLFSILMRIENGLITKYRLFEDSYAVSESLKE